MKRSMGIALIVAGVSLIATTSFAAVNCNQVKKYLGTGRTAQDVADTMVIPVDEVKKCQEGSDAAGTQAVPPAAGANSSAAGAAQGSPKK
jgi:hypothetical protein